MRKVTLWMSILIVFSLAACSFSPGGTPNASAVTPTKSGEQMQTEISQLLTIMPTMTGQPVGEATAAPALPTVAVQTETPSIEKPAEEVLSPTAPPAPSNTPKPLPTTAGSLATATLVNSPTAGPSPTKGSGPTATVSPGDPRTRLGNPSSKDAMDNANTWIWPTGSDLYTQAQFTNGRMSVQALTTKDGWRMANPKGQAFSDLYLEAKFDTGETCQRDNPGMDDHYGLIVRVPDLRQPWQGYLFSFTCTGQYSLRSWNWDGKDARRQEMRMLIDWNSPKTAVINAGSRATNKMGIMMIGSRLRLYANGTFLAEYDTNANANIPHLSSGYFGVFVGSRNDTKFTVWVDEMAYWENPTP